MIQQWPIVSFDELSVSYAVVLGIDLIPVFVVSYDGQK